MLTLRKNLTLAAILGLALTACTAAEASEQVSTVSPSDEHAHWSYDGAQGPDNWADLDESYATCATGTAQSPVDLPLPVDGERTSEFTITTERTKGYVEDNGHTVQFTDEDEGSEITYAGKEYDLLQYHVHTPSEHTVNGEPAAAEFHFVHQAEDDSLLVLGVLATEGRYAGQWAPFVRNAQAERAEIRVNLARLLPRKLSHTAYQGSLTTPPCTEGVQWLVLDEPVELGARQIEQLAGAHPHNSRGVQELGDRELTGGRGIRLKD
ncbi:carbonic anhydrase [Kineosporia babensis]|uniref:carbonic anhydrase n=1 Tax=Kineosporia babensis TaxID=499548 RepID=A0A9X1T3T9_9ACTN|nr:carbonic anhydrase family protein [Kineosporia babensis]MCD5316078.1 carbonic anhydrase family protein [Kineosporia babensis]